MESNDFFYKLKSFLRELRVLRALHGFFINGLVILIFLTFTTKDGHTKPTFFKSPDQLEQIIKEDQGDLLIIDIRPTIHFNKKSIINSLNISPIILKTKTFLKNKKLVLVDEGIDYCTVKNLAKELSTNGFKEVFALEGGLRYYQFKNKGLQIIEDSLESRYGLTVVSLQKVLHCKSQSPLLIDLRNKERFEKEKIEGSLWFDYRLDTAMSDKITLKEKTDELINYIKNTLTIEQEAGKKNTVADYKYLSDETKYPVILIDEQGKHTPRLGKLLSRQKINTFYLIGGMESWNLYVYEIPAARKRESIKKDTECSECNEN